MVAGHGLDLALLMLRMAAGGFLLPHALGKLFVKRLHREHTHTLLITGHNRTQEIAADVASDGQH